MGDCKYCSLPAGFLRRQHGECQDIYESKTDELRVLVSRSATEGGDLSRLPSQIRQIGAEGFMDISESELRQVLLSGWVNGVVHSVFGLSLNETKGHNRETGRAFTIDLQRPRKSRLTDVAIGNLNRYRRFFALADNELKTVDRNALTTFHQGLVLRYLKDKGSVPKFDRESFERRHGRLPFRLMKSETLVWVLKDTKYHKATANREFRGGSTGFSVRVADGLTLRQSGFRGHAVESVSMQHQDTGNFGFTTKHIYFSGSKSSFRVRLDRVVSVRPFNEGLGIMRDGANAKLEIFATRNLSDIWFGVSLLDALTEIDESSLDVEDSSSLRDQLFPLSDDVSLYPAPDFKEERMAY